MGTLAAGIKDIFSTAKTTGTNVMLSANDGTPDGHISMVNLASVLGAFKPQSQVTSGSANDCKDIGFYIIRAGVTDLPSPFLNTFATFVYTFSNGGAGTVGGANSYIQIASNYAVEGIYIRKGYDNNWSAWSRADGFGYGDLSSLASAMGIDIKVKMKKNFLEANDSVTITTKNVHCGFMVYSPTGEYIPIPYYVTFNTNIGVQGASVKRETAGGLVTVTSGSSWFTFVTFIWEGSN